MLGTRRAARYRRQISVQGHQVTTLPGVFKFETDDRLSRRSPSNWFRLVALSGVFLIVMVALTLAAMIVVGFVLFYVVRAVQD